MHFEIDHQLSPIFQAFDAQAQIVKIKFALKVKVRFDFAAVKE